ncbi:MAG: lipoyl(octanoyl) transferase LipB [Ignavibacteriales bacterium]
MDGFKAYRLGMVDYQEALNLQLSLIEKRRNEEMEDVLLLLEHPPTFTMGRSGKTEHLLKSQEELRRNGIHFEIISRGGDITYHGPGQLVGYPILDLDNFNRDVNQYLRNIEEVIIRALCDFEIKAERIKGFTGVWVGEDGEKIASIGVGIKNWITYHGFALNVNTDLSYFDMMIPCGIQGVKMTSMKKFLGMSENIEMEDVETSIIDAFSKVFDRRLNNITSADQKILDGVGITEHLIET